MPPPAHLSGAEDLVTKPEATRAGFLALAIERNRLSTPLVAQARALKVAAASAGSVERCVGDPSIRPAVLAAAGVSDKAAKHFTEAEEQAAIKDLADSYLALAGTNFPDELAARFLLTKGDAIGGAMRNVGGRLGQRKLLRAMASALEIGGATYHWLDRDKVWHAARANEAGFEIDARGLHWTRQGKNRTLLFNRRVPAVRTNVDLCLLNCEREQADAAIGNPSAFVALGELKGGVDPAGADEHWKTTRSALARIRTAFAESEAHPPLFFIGAAIVRTMAGELWRGLENNAFANAANLTDDGQLAAVAQWIRTL